MQLPCMITILLTSGLPLEYLMHVYKHTHMQGTHGLQPGKSSVRYDVHLWSEGSGQAKAEIINMHA